MYVPFTQTKMQQASFCRIQSAAAERKYVLLQNQRLQYHRQQTHRNTAGHTGLSPSVSSLLRGAVNEGVIDGRDKNSLNSATPDMSPPPPSLALHIIDHWGTGNAHKKKTCMAVSLLEFPIASPSISPRTRYRGGGVRRGAHCLRLFFFLYVDGITINS